MLSCCLAALLPCCLSARSPHTRRPHHAVDQLLELLPPHHLDLHPFLQLGPLRNLPGRPQGNALS
eukprot:SAG22_NODE_2856_length_2153_cov_1.616845_5_plen_65_part_00